MGCLSGGKSGTASKGGAARGARPPMSVASGATEPVFTPTIFPLLTCTR